MTSALTVIQKAAARPLPPVPPPPLVPPVPPGKVPAPQPPGPVKPMERPPPPRVLSNYAREYGMSLAYEGGKWLAHGYLVNKFPSGVTEIIIHTAWEQPAGIVRSTVVSQFSKS